MTREPRTWLELLGAIAEHADRIALERFRAQDLRVEEKPDLGPVTEADLAIEEAARRLVRERHPELGVWGEEQGSTGEQDEQRLIIDPIDATRNFVRGIPIFATLLAIEERGEVVAGLVTAPALSTRWHAARGAGAWSGSRRLQVSRVARIESAQVFHGSLGGDEATRAPAGLVPLLRASARQRGLGDFYQHLMVAEGAGEVAIDPVVNPWDVAALLVIVEEAGGRSTSLSGLRSIRAGSFVSTNGLLHDEALRRLGAAG